MRLGGKLLAAPLATAVVVLARGRAGGWLLMRESAAGAASQVDDYLMLADQAIDLSAVDTGTGIAAPLRRRAPTPPSPSCCRPPPPGDVVGRFTLAPATA